MKHKTRDQRLAADLKLIDGLQQHLGQLPAIPVGSQMMAPADIVKVLQERIGVGKASQKADADRTAALQTEQDELAKTAIVVSSFIRMVEGMFSRSPDVLAQFGLKPRKATTPSSATKAAAAAKRKATRTARHTMGPKQKKATDFCMSGAGLELGRVALLALA